MAFRVGPCEEQPLHAIHHTEGLRCIERERRGCLDEAPPVLPADPEGLGELRRVPVPTGGDPAGGALVSQVRALVSGPGGEVLRWWVVRRERSASAEVAGFRLRV